MKYKELFENRFEHKLDPKEDCPYHFGWMPVDSRDPKMCAEGRCEECWNQEAPGMSNITNDLAGMGRAAKTAGAVLTKTMGAIKDSGDRTQFATGAVRDMREGKGRCDLMPLAVVARLYGNHDGKTNMFEYIARFQNTNGTHHLVKALFKFAEEAYGGTERESMCTMLLEVAKHYEEGAKKYGESNWQKGIPTYCYIDSAVRHYLKWLRGDKDEPHDRAFVWNLLCCIWEVDYHKEEQQ